jgi:hypothetical protein
LSSYKGVGDNDGRRYKSGGDGGSNKGGGDEAEGVEAKESDSSGSSLIYISKRIFKRLNKYTSTSFEIKLRYLN